MVRKIVYLIFTITFLITVCTWEEVAVHNYLGQIDYAVSTIQTLVAAGEKIDIPDMLFAVEEVEEIWKQKENKFCVVLNHQQVEAIGVEIAHLKAAVINNNEEEFVIALSSIRFYVDNLNHILGFSIQNLL